MAITLKEFAYFVKEFVNKNFIPHLQTGTDEHEKCLQRWRQVTDIFRDLQKVNLWNLEQYLKKLDIHKGSNYDKESKQYKKYQNSKASPITFNTEYDFYDKKELPMIPFIQGEIEVKNSLKTNSVQSLQLRNKAYKYGGSEEYQTKLSFQSRGSKQKTESVGDSQGFEKLMQSFRKLYLNFQNNHKKLLKQDQNYKQNYKEQLVQL